MIGEGKQVSQCFRAVSAYGTEIEALCEALNSQLTEEFSKLKDGFALTVVGKLEEQSREDEWGWVYTDLAYSLPLKGKRKRHAEMYLSYQISLMGDGMSFDGNDEPLLHVCFWDCKIDFDGEGVYMAYPADQENLPRLRSNRLIFWEGLGDDWKKDQWTFSLRLLELKTSRDLHDCVVKPALALLRGVDVMEALPDDLPGLVIYTDDSVLIPAVHGQNLVK